MAMRFAPLVLQISTQGVTWVAARNLEMEGANAPKTIAHSASQASRR